MRSKILKSFLRPTLGRLTGGGAGRAAHSLACTALALLGAGILARPALAQQAINLTAAPATAALPDGSAVPMWGYSCGTAVSGSTATCAALNPNAGTHWSPVVITIPTGQDLSITLTNNLVFTPAGQTGTVQSNGVPTSLTMVGQLGGGLGSIASAVGAAGGTKVASPPHAPQGVTWPTTNTGSNFYPPPQANRIQSFATEVAAGTSATLCWGVCGTSGAGAQPALKPGTYLIESGTHPSIQAPMGLYGILVVTTAPTATAAGVAYPAVGTTAAVSYAAEVPLLMSEIDPVQNNSVNAAVNTLGFVENSTHIMQDTFNTVLITNAGQGYKATDLVSISGGACSTPPVATASIASVDTTGSVTGTVGAITGLNVSVTNPGAGCTSAPVVTVTSATGTGASLLASMQVNQFTCSNGATACYPPAVNYTPLYYLWNGVAFDKTHIASSLFAATTGTAGTGTAAAPASGNLLVRLVNAGLHMHVPSIVNSTSGPQAGAPAGAVAVPGFALIAEDGNRLPGVPKVQSEVFMAAGKTYDVMINTPAVPVAPAVTAPLPIYDRELSLSGNAVNRDSGLLAYIGVNGAAPAAGASATAAANPDAYPSLVAGLPFSVSDPSKGVIANDKNVFGVTLLTQATSGTVTLAQNGTFTYAPNAGSMATSDSFTYCANGSVTAAACSSGLTATVSLSGATLETASAITSTPATVPTCLVTSTGNLLFTATTSSYLAVKSPGLLCGAKDAAGYPLTVVPNSVMAAGLTVYADVNGGFTASGASAGTYSLSFKLQNSQGVQSAVQSASLVFPTGSGLAVTVEDGVSKAVITDYRWAIEEDQTFYVNPNCSTNPPGPNCPAALATGVVPTFGVNFHTSHMPFVAQGCTGPLSCEYGQTVQGVPSVCDVSNGVCRPGTQKTVVLPSAVALDPTKRYYISVLPGDAANPFQSGYGGAPNCTATAAGTSTPSATCGHGMGGAPIGIDPNTNKQATAVTILAQPAPYPPAKLSVFVYEDDFPLNGEQDGGGGVDTLSPNEPGLGGFQIHLWDAMGQNGDFTGQMTYDMFNQPLTNSLDGTTDPASGLNACPITQLAQGITGMIVTCPKYESDGKTLSPLAGQAVIANLMPGRFGVIATPAADRIARGEEWLQTNTLDGQKAHDSFVRIGEPSYFQEFGPASFHVSVGFANPAIINARHAGVCAGTDINITGAGCTWTANAANPNVGTGTGYSIIGRVVGEHLSRTPDERIYGSGSHDTFYWTQCYASFGDPDGEDFVFTKCNADGTFTLTGLPAGDWRVTTFDQWNDQLVDGLSTPVGLGGTATINCPGPKTTATLCDMGDVAATQWETNLYTRTFIDDNKDGVSQAGETGIPFANVAVRMRDGSLENLIVTDFTGTANFNETFPLFSWYTVETDYLRYKNTGTHVVYDVGGPTDQSPSCGVAGYPVCGASTIGKYLANTAEEISVPANLRIPGSVYCAGADCTGKSIQNGPASSDPPSVCTVTPATATAPATTSCSTKLSSGRIDNPWLGGIEGWQGFPGQNNFMEFGKEPYVPGENGGIKGHVIYASTRPFDDPQMLVQTQWEPLVPHVTINLYQEGFAADKVTPTLTLVDTTTTSSFDDYAQGFHAAPAGVTPALIPNMNCPGQGATSTISGGLADLFFFSLYNQPDYLNLYAAQHATPGTLNTAALPTPLPANSQYKCYDGMHNWNQIQPVPYDGVYQFPSVTATDPTTGKPTATNCKICSADTVVPTSDLYYGVPMLPPGKYVVEVVVPPGMELVKEEDKNILIGDSFIAPVTQQFGALGNIFIIPDQASVAASANTYNLQNPTQSLGAAPNDSTVPSYTVEPVWPCVGTARIVPDYISLYPQTKQVAPFAGAKRNLCDRKEVTLSDEMGAIAKFYVYTSTHLASKFTGGITDDYTSEFDPFSPQFGEKFAPPNLPVSVKDWAGNETNRVYADQWGAYNGMTYSTWEVNPPNPTGYSPTMMVLCMNDPGPILDTRTGSATNGQMITDPAYTQGYSQFCYELPFMPATTQYLDTPVVPTSAFAGAGYNNVDCAYPDATPAIASVLNAAAETGVINPNTTPATTATLPALSGPWVVGSGHNLIIAALGDQQVPNNAYSGPSATTAPFNQRTITRHYGFGAQCKSPIAGSATCNTLSKVTIGNVAATINSWTDMSINITVPTGVASCETTQQAVFGGTTLLCGQLVITAGNGKQSVDTVTVTIGGKVPTVVKPTTPLSEYGIGSLQKAIDAAAPGDLLLLQPGTYTEMVLMWKPVRLQGVGAASVILNANTQPAGKFDPWRREVNCLFGLALDGAPITTSHPFDSTGTYACGANGSVNFAGTAATLAYFAPGLLSDGTYNPQVDRLPLEATVGWDATLNGNLAELLQEPTLMGALEGAGITVLSKGVTFPSNPFAADTFPTGTTLVTSATCPTKTKAGALIPTPLASNFWCNPSRIDGISVTDSSQGGGGIFVHAWGHNLQIANNRIKNNAGTLSGGINVGQGEFPPAYIVGSSTNAAPGSCASTSGSNATFNEYGTAVTIVPNALEPYCHNVNVNIHNNYVSLNSSTGDELFSATPAGAGGVSFCTGADNYKFNYNWVCGNLSSGDGGGLGHLGFIFNGDIEHNTFVFNQSLNPTIPANGGAMVIMGAPDVDPPCSTLTDADCVGAPNLIGPSDGVGPGLKINANLIVGNAAEAGTGGGIAFQNVNGSEVIAFPNTPAQWYSPQVTNNIIANNVAGWDGGGVSLEDALNINLINNTIVSNDTTATAGVLFNALGAPLASQQGPTCTANCGTQSQPQPAGIVTIPNSAVLAANFPATGITCPAGHYAGTTALKGTCMTVGYPELYNNLLWQNTAYNIGVGPMTPTYQQSVVSLLNAVTGTAVPTQPAADATATNGGGVVITGGTGACLAGATYWDLGVRGDTAPGQHALGVSLDPLYSILTNPAENGPGTNNFLGDNPQLLSQYCNGSRQPPEFGASGWAVPPGISDATVPNPVFNLTPVATVDEGNNWINLRWGPLTLSNPSVTGGANGNYGGGAPLGNFSPALSSPAIDHITSTAATYAAAPTTDFFGNARKTGNAAVDVGAIQHTATNPAGLAVVSPNPLVFPNAVVGGVATTATLTVSNDGTALLTGVTVGTPTTPFTRAAGAAGGTCATATPVAAGGSCTIILTFTPTAVQTYTGTVAITNATVTIDGAPVTLTGTGIAPVRSISFSPSPVAFGSWAVGKTSPTYTVTITNTGNIALTGGTNTWQANTPTEVSGPFSVVALTPNGCTGNLGLGASCVFGLVYKPVAAGPQTATLGLNYTGMTQTNLSISGTGIAGTAPALAFQNSPALVTIPAGKTSVTGFIGVYNNAPVGGAQLQVSAEMVAGGVAMTGAFTLGADTLVTAPGSPCTGAILAPQQVCQTAFIFTKGPLEKSGTVVTGSMTFTEVGGVNASQQAALQGKD